MLNEPNPGTAFRGLPLSAQQEREITHFIEAHQRAGQEWDTPELAALIRDMLHPPEVGDEDGFALADSRDRTFYGAARRAQRRRARARRRRRAVVQGAPR